MKKYFILILIFSFIALLGAKDLSTVRQLELEEKFKEAEETLIELVANKKDAKTAMQAGFKLANYYTFGRKDLEKDLKKARIYYDSTLKEATTIASKKDLDALYIKAMCLFSAWGKREEAVAALLKAAHAGHPEAQVAVALKMFRGHGIKRNLELALVWLKKSAKNGSMKGKAYLAGHYFIKEYNIDKAVELAQASADHGNASGQFVLGMAYLKGRGLNRNYQKGFELIEKADAQGQVDAIKFLKSPAARKARKKQKEEKELLGL